MWIRDPSGRWAFSRPTALRVLRLDGSGALHPHRSNGVLRIERRGVCVTAYPISPVDVDGEGGAP